MKQLWIFVCTMIFIACQSNTAQNNKKSLKDMQKSPPITAVATSDSITYNNYYDQMVKAVKHYPEEPVYMVYVNNEQCYYELLVNDMPVAEYFDQGKRMSPYYINSNILKSGKQTLTYRIYPETGRGMMTLGDYTSIGIDIGVIDQKKGFKASNMDTVMVHQSLKTPDGKHFIASGKDYYEYTFEFEAKVPYNEIGLAKSKDLRKMDQKELLHKTEEAYHYLAELIRNKDKDQFARLNFNAVVRQYINGYDTPDMIKDSFTILHDWFYDKTLKVNPLKDYSLKFYGEGRVVSLILNSKVALYRNSSALSGNYIDEDGDEAVQFFRILLHIPEGKDSFEVF